jgi:FKBP-type peptidyl-prolyl cis-trans isomerase SlpA
MTEQSSALGSSDELRIGQNTEVTLHFALRLENGDTVDSTFDKAPATFKVGDGNLLPGFEAAIFGFKAGDRRTVQILPENAFGQPNPQNVQIMPRSQFQDMDLSEGLLVIFNDAANTELPGVVKAFDDEQVTIDFNHPLAGKTLDFEVQILEVKAILAS